jgi:hypothetical protein
MIANRKRWPMSEPIKITKKKMLEELNFLISTQDPYYRTDTRVVNAIRYFIKNADIKPPRRQNNGSKNKQDD